jgi:hypothetical protein
MAETSTDDWREHQERRDRLVARYGKPEMVSAAEALRALGKRDEIHPDDVCAFLHRSQEAFAAFAESNRTHNGLETYGPLVTDAGVIGVVDLRSQLPVPTDPALPDKR